MCKADESLDGAVPHFLPLGLVEKEIYQRRLVRGMPVFFELQVFSEKLAQLADEFVSRHAEAADAEKRRRRYQSIAVVTFHHIESISFSAFRSHPVFGIKEPVRFQHLQAS